MFAAVLLAAIAFLAGVWFAERTDSPHDTRDFDIFWQSWSILEREFYYDLPEERELIYGAIQGLLSKAGDPYTFFAPPRQASFDRQRIAGEFGGIGAYVGLNADGQLTITALFAGYPAEEAGLQVQDIILEVDGQSIAGWTLEDSVARLRGEVGSRVTLSIYRPRDDSRFTVEIKRARVELPTVIATTYDRIGYVRLFSFNDRATELLSGEIDNLLDQGVAALILDLRGNPGGLLDQAVSVSDLFLDEGVVVTQKDRSGHSTVYRSATGQPAESVPLAVLIDGTSASAAEVVAGALQDRGRAVLIGQPSFGKGSVQHVHDLPDGSQIHVTVALWFTPNETPIQGQGLVPDIPIEDSGTAVETEDPYLTAALDYLTAQLEESAGE
jgi:carboxyl-terminal processing protease